VLCYWASRLCCTNGLTNAEYCHWTWASADIYNESSNLGAKEFSQLFLPLSETVEALFQTFLPSEHSKYRAAYEAIYDRRADPVDMAFGIWTSRSLVINANTNNHKDLEDVYHGWCAVVAMGDFDGDDACFPELRVKINCPPGT